MKRTRAIGARVSSKSETDTRIPRFWRGAVAVPCVQTRCRNARHAGRYPGGVGGESADGPAIRGVGADIRKRRVPGAIPISVIASPLAWITFDRVDRRRIRLPRGIEDGPFKDHLERFQI